MSNPYYVIQSIELAATNRLHSFYTDTRLPKWWWPFVDVEDRFGGMGAAKRFATVDEAIAYRENYTLLENWEAAIVLIDLHWPSTQR